MSKTFNWSVRVYYEDTDAGGIVYYANYLKFIERARTEWVRSMGVNQEKLKEEQGIIFVVHSLQIQYLKPAQLDDTLDVTVHLTKLGKAALDAEQVVSRDGEPLIKAQVKIACLNKESMKPMALPAELKQNMEAYCG